MLRGGFQYLLIRGGTGLLVIAAIPVFTRLLPPEEYGRYALGMTCALVISAVVYQWLGASFGRFHAAHIERPGLVAGTALRAFRIVTLLLLGVAALAAPLAFAWGVQPLLYAGVLVVAIGLGRYNLSLQAANSMHAPRTYAALSWTRSGMALALALALLPLQPTAGTALATAVVGVAAALLLRDPLRGTHAAKPPGAALNAAFLRYGLPLTLTTMAIVVVDVADRLLIAGMLGSAKVGPYSCAYDLVQQSLGAPLNVLLLASYPAIIAAHEQEPLAARQRLHRAGSAVLALGLPAAVGLSVLAYDLSHLMFGRGFRTDAIAMIPWLAWGLFFGALKSYYFDLSFQLAHRTRIQGAIAAGMAALNIGLNLLLLPRLGVLGAAIATTASFAAGLLASALLGRRVLRLPALRDQLPRACAAAAGMYAALHALAPLHSIPWLAAKLLIGALSYLALALALNVGGSRDALKRRLARLAPQPVDL